MFDLITMVLPVFVCAVVTIAVVAVAVFGGYVFTMVVDAVRYVYCRIFHKDHWVHNTILRPGAISFSKSYCAKCSEEAENNLQ